MNELQQDYLEKSDRIVTDLIDSVVDVTSIGALKGIDRNTEEGSRIAQIGVGIRERIGEIVVLRKTMDAIPMNTRGATVAVTTYHSLELLAEVAKEQAEEMRKRIAKAYPDAEVLQDQPGIAIPPKPEKSDTATDSEDTLAKLRKLASSGIQSKAPEGLVGLAMVEVYLDVANRQDKRLRQIIKKLDRIGDNVS